MACKPDKITRFPWVHDARSSPHPCVHVLWKGIQWGRITRSHPGWNMHAIASDESRTTGIPLLWTFNGPDALQPNKSLCIDISILFNRECRRWNLTPRDKIIPLFRAVEGNICMYGIYSSIPCLRYLAPLLSLASAFAMPHRPSVIASWNPSPELGVVSWIV